MVQSFLLRLKKQTRPGVESKGLHESLTFNRREAYDPATSSAVIGWPFSANAMADPFGVNGFNEGDSSMSQFIEALNVVGLYGRFDLNVRFTKDVNIVYGANGAGKTTMLHILANVASLDLERFAYLPFQSIKVEMAQGPTIEIVSNSNLTDESYAELELWVNGKDEVRWRVDLEIQRSEGIPWFSPHESVQHFKEKHNIEVDATYFPAFRTMREAWSFLDPQDLVRSGMLGSHHRLSRMNRRERGIAQRDRRLTMEETDPQMTLTREIFGEFVPYVNYPSPRDIQRNLDEAIQIALNRLAIGDRTLLSEAFNSVFEAISPGSEQIAQDFRTPENIRASIGALSKHLQLTQSEYGVPEGNSAFDALGSQIASSERPGQGENETTTRVLLVYEDALKKRDKNLEDAFSTVRAYFDAVNDFLEGKQLAAISTPTPSTPRLRIRHSNGTLSQLDTLSSGERQIAGLIYSASHLAEGNVILVDEPELSLHIDWQETIIEAMVRQLPSKQLIVCTHSPVIGAEYMEEMIPLEPAPTESPTGQEIEVVIY